MHTAVLCLIPFAVIITFASAKIQTSDVPTYMAQCYGRFKKKTTLARTPGAAIQSYCDNMYMWHKSKELNVNRGAKIDAMSYINKVFENTKQEIQQFRVKRKKRQAGTPPPKLRLRKEIRMMSDEEITLLFDAINSAKKNTTISPNKYDAMAEFHTGETSVTAHGGCNFHGWHRMYILMFENALRDEGPQFADVTFPYWDSTLDYYLDDPLESALWSDRLFGSCEGEAKGGIMGTGWDSSVGIITRNCGTDGPLMSDDMIHNVTKNSRLGEICGEDSEIDHDLEFHHNGAHRWIDGQMAQLASAVYDPVFWFHHTFIDKVWEDFRENQKRNGVDRESDYPPNPAVMGDPEGHGINANLGFSTSLLVIDGLSDMFTSEWYKYAPSPTCTFPKKDCGSKWLKCVENKASNNATKAFRCVARNIMEVEEYEESLKHPPKNPNCLEAPELAKLHEIHAHKPVKEIKPVQNTFCMNGKSDVGQWVYVPIKIILKRPPDYVNYGSYRVQGGKMDKTGGDIYSPRAYSNVYRHLRRTTPPATYEDCINPEVPTNTIYVKSVGLNYEGIYKEYAILDRRLAITISTAYLAVRKPMSPTDTSVAMLHAQDSCGRVCKPVCKVPGTEIFRPCSGAVKVSGQRPLQFGNSFGDAVLDIWDFDADKDCPQLTTNQMVVSFYCDYSTDWFWPSVDPGSLSAGPAVTPLPPVPQTTVAAGCSLGFGCVVKEPCSALTRCQNGHVVECLKSCHMYAACFNNQYMLYQCRRGERYLKGKGCVSSRANPCDYSTSGLRRWQKRNMQKRRRRRGL